MRHRNRVIIVDDDPGMLKGVARLLRHHAYEPILFPSPQAFKSHTDFDSAVCLILDINLNDGSGIELRYRLKADGVSVPVIYMSGNDNLDVQKAALASGHRVFEEAILSTGTHRAGQESCHASRERYVLRRHGGRDTLVSVRALAAQRQRWQIG